MSTEKHTKKHHEYNPETGILTIKVRGTEKIVAGKVINIRSRDDRSREDDKTLATMKNLTQEELKEIENEYPSYKIITFRDVIPGFEDECDLEVIG
ncbi:MAG: hypothetical protein KJI71_01020 [Patescibacteria group bacterium]|nr:hypothetical protein [Patescibacteria group bacterium]